jgi:uncharacterized damage-inducible protein DinB
MTSDAYRFGGARALVALHDQHLREFLEVWRRAREAEVTLPAASDPNYASLETLLAHVLKSAAGYLAWICRQLELPKPRFPELPSIEELPHRAREYAEAVLEAWQAPLRELTEEQAYLPDFPSPWESRYCIDAMLEHAVMHPVRHAHQLRELMAARQRER